MIYRWSGKSPPPLRQRLADAIVFLGGLAFMAALIAAAAWAIGL